MILKLLIALLIGYLGWRWWKGLPRRSPARPFAPVFDEAEARAVLGVDADADAETIRAAHRRLMVALHPVRPGVRRGRGARGAGGRCRCRCGDDPRRAPPADGCPPSRSAIARTFRFRVERALAPPLPERQHIASVVALNARCTIE